MKMKMTSATAMTMKRMTKNNDSQPHDERLLDLVGKEVETILGAIGEDKMREGLRDTPERAARAMMEATALHRAAEETATDRNGDETGTEVRGHDGRKTGGRFKIASAIGRGMFRYDPALAEANGDTPGDGFAGSSPSSSMTGQSVVSVQNIECYSSDIDTLLPMKCVVGVSYRPGNGIVLGLSKFARVVNAAAKKLHTAEGLADTLMDVLAGAVRPEAMCVRVDVKKWTNVSDRTGQATVIHGEPEAGRMHARNGSACPVRWETIVRHLSGVNEIDVPPTPRLVRDDRRRENGAANGVADSRTRENGFDNSDARGSEDLHTSGSYRWLPLECRNGTAIADAVSRMLKLLAPDLDSVAHERVSGNYARHLLESTVGYSMDRAINGAGEDSSIASSAPDEGAKRKREYEWVVCNLPLSSLCEHHLLPFRGHTSIVRFPLGDALPPWLSELMCVHACVTWSTRARKRERERR